MPRRRFASAVESQEMAPGFDLDHEFTPGPPWSEVEDALDVGLA